MKPGKKMWNQRFIFPQIVLKLEVAFFQLNFQASLYNTAQLGTIVENKGRTKRWGERERGRGLHTHTNLTQRGIVRNNIERITL